MKKIILFFVCLLFCSYSCRTVHRYNSLRKKLQVKETGGSAQIEIGGPYVGIEMHASSPLLNRISFFYPVANSIDLSEDYWKRDQYHVLSLGLKVGDQPKQWLGLESSDLELTPFSAHFRKSDEQRTINISYHFCKHKPAMVAFITVTSNLQTTVPFEIYTHLETSLKTCHSYKLKDKAWTEFHDAGSTLYTHFDDSETGNAQIFVANAGEKPDSYTTVSESSLQKKALWINESNLAREIIPQSEPKRPASAFLYRKNLAAGQSLKIVQIIGSCKFGQGRDIVAYLLKNYRQEIDDYEHSVLDKALKGGLLASNDHTLDHSAHWAKAILAVNEHYIDDHIVPMPCPAQYNFFFTHDVLLTDLAAVNFDAARVANDLSYIAEHANDDNIIPHAYYWKDEHYVAEFAEADNWNHFWFIILAARYLRHGADFKTIEKYFPIIEKSMHLISSNIRGDGLVWARRPDWWDIGNSEGPRSYMTILTIQSLREFIYICTLLGKETEKLAQMEETVSLLTQQINAKLWDANLNYLLNYYHDGKKDEHLYSGSLLAAHFNVLDDAKRELLIKTATTKLLDDRIGIYNAFPMDFHNLISYLKMNGNEAGDPFYYMNGGIWSHGNAWYALGLMATEEREGAFQFIKNTMTLKGVMDSPNGQPAMCEYRISNAKNPSAYGKVDKPQFLWAAGWYLYCLYAVYGVNENQWNISFCPHAINAIDAVQLDVLLYGKLIHVRMTGRGPYFQYIKYDNKNIPSAVVSQDIADYDRIEFKLGKPEIPYVSSLDAELISSVYDENSEKLILKLKAFPFHNNETRIISPTAVKSVVLNGQPLEANWKSENKNGIYETTIHFFHQSQEDVLVVNFNN